MPPEKPGFDPHRHDKKPFINKKSVFGAIAAATLGAFAGSESHDASLDGKNVFSQTHEEKSERVAAVELSPKVKNKLEEYRLLIEKESPGDGENMVTALKGFLGNKDEAAQLELIDAWMKGPTISNPEKK
ncbi:MAG: hypothetical protein AAB467_04095 [Patescibacteria group bacterium]